MTKPTPAEVAAEKIEDFVCDSFIIRMEFIGSERRAVINIINEALTKHQEALEFYADEENYDPDGVPGNIVGDTDEFEPDKGVIARNALGVE